MLGGGAFPQIDCEPHLDECLLRQNTTSSGSRRGPGGPGRPLPLLKLVKKDGRGTWPQVS